MSTTSSKTRVPAVEGLFTITDEPQLIGGKVPGAEAYFFPATALGADPAIGPVETEEVLLSRRGTIWSYTSSDYQPPPPYIPMTDPYVPITIAAVELDVEQLVILGQMVPGVTPGDLKIGDAVELTVGTLYEDETNEYLTWMWRPVDG